MSPMSRDLEHYTERLLNLTIPLMFCMTAVAMTRSRVRITY